MDRRRVNISAYAMLAPFAAVFVGFAAWPVLRAAWLSTRITAGALDRGVGIANFRFMVGDGIMWFAVANTVAFSLAFLLLQLPLSVALALLMNRPDIRGRTACRLGVFAGYLVGPVYVAVLFAGLLARDTGVVNALLRLVGVRQVNWLAEPGLALAVTLAAALWGGVGFGMVVCLSALRSMDPAIADAARVDGAGAWSRLWHVTLPALRPALAFLAVVGLAGGLQLFELPFVLFGGAGPGNAALTLGMYLFATGFEGGDLGYASAVGWVMAATAGAASLAALRMLRRGGMR